MGPPPESGRDAATSIVRTLRGAGHVAYFAGGCVRDELLGLHPEDYDVATDAPPERVQELFRVARAVGKSFGVVLVRPPRSGGHIVEVATFRREHGYSDKRRPDRVAFCDARTDAFRRDFTINALFIDPLDTADRPGGRIIDYIGGLEDLQRGVIRAVGDADARLAEDHLRALRAVRFAARLAFALDPATAEAIRRHALELQGVSRERIGDEIRRALGHPTRREAVRLLGDLGLDGPVLDERPAGRIEYPAVAGLDPESGFTTALAAWAVDRLVPPSQGFARAALILRGQRAGVVQRWRRALCLSNEERDGLSAILDAVGSLALDWPGLGVAGRKRLAASPACGPALTILRIRAENIAREIEGEIRRLAGSAGGLNPAPFLTGDDLISDGMTPGPSFGRWLEAAYDAQLEGRVATPDEALALIRRLFAEAAGGGPPPAQSR